MDVLHTLTDLRARLASAPSVALVPTMGSLHEGHLSLVREARRHADCVVASIFVNRLQFGAGEDFDRYPRSLEQDCALLAQAGCDVVFAPTEDVLYPRPQRVFVEPSDLQHLLEGAVRPGHYRGVCTVVMKLFQAVQPQVALFGLKDYQQWRVLGEMVDDLGLPIRMLGGATVRASDGLALSSRNAYLTPEQRAEAPCLYEVLQRVGRALRQASTAARCLPEGTDPARAVAAILATGQQACAEGTALLATRGWQVDYLTVRRQADLREPEPGDRDLVVLVAARLGATRLIDNLELSLGELPA